MKFVALNKINRNKINVSMQFKQFKKLTLTLNKDGETFKLKGTIDDSSILDDKVRKVKITAEKTMINGNEVTMLVDNNGIACAFIIIDSQEK